MVEIRDGQGRKEREVSGWEENGSLPSPSPLMLFVLSILTKKAGDERRKEARS